ncbi:MAG: lysoplasmalogenase [Chitinophagales bacterium]|nr:lysoplasmalogenase [Chitinophagales bacterium]
MNDLLKRYKYFTIFYLLIFIANIIVLYVITDYRMVAKPMILGSLLGFYIGNVINQSPIFMLGMVFALMGDIFLMVNNEVFFAIGLGSFLLMQILYSVEFLKDVDFYWKRDWIPMSVIYGIGIIFFTWVAGSLGSLMWPVFIYMLAITTMVGFAWLRKKGTVWYREVVAGALLFLTSDAWLGLSKFGVIESDHSGLVVMVTYMLAQYLIVRGIVERDVTA